MEQYSHLRELLAPQSAENFVTEYFSRAELHIPRNDTSFFASHFRLSDLDTLLQNEFIPAVAYNVVAGGKRLGIEEWAVDRTLPRGSFLTASPAKLMGHYHTGATLIVNGAHRSIPAMTTLCRNLSAELGISVQANIYITPPRSQGFSRHEDDHDVLVLQIEGTKKWIVYGESGPREYELAPGDTLYVPRGMQHEARSNEGPAVHVTLGLHAIYASRLMEELAQLMTTHPDFRAALPLGPDAGGAEAKSRLLAEMQAFLTRTGMDTLVQKYRDRLATRQPQGGTGRFEDALSDSYLKLESVIVAREGVLKSITSTDREIVVTISDSRIALPFFFETAVRRILEPMPLRIAEVPGLIPDNAKVDFVRPFLRAGLLRIVSL